MNTSLQRKAVISNEKDIIISNFRDTINNLTNIIVNNANKMKDINDFNSLNKNSHSSIETEAVDLAKSNKKYKDQISELEDNNSKINRLYKTLNLVYTNHIKTSMNIEKVYKSKLIDLSLIHI